MRKLYRWIIVLSTAAVMPVSTAPPRGSQIPVPLDIEVDSLGGECGVCGDLGSVNTTYSHGEPGVEAVIDKFGNLIFNLQGGTRFLAYGYWDDPPTGLTLAGPGTRHYLATIAASGTTVLPFQQLGEGSNPASQLITTCPVYYDDSGVQYRHAFGRTCGLDPSQTSLVRVTRHPNEGGKRVWTLETEDPGTARVFHLTKGKTVYVHDGYYDLPFKMTLTEQ